jgi:hypothetical protein
LKVEATTENRKQLQGKAATANSLNGRWAGKCPERAKKKSRSCESMVFVFGLLVRLATRRLRTATLTVMHVPFQ